jgi:hypothetical protein
MSDVLGKLSEEQVAAWYGRLADWVSRTLKSKLGGGEPLSAQLLRHWLQGKGKAFTFTPPKHLKESRYVKAELTYHRKVYLTQEKARLGKATVIAGIKVHQETSWAGIIPRLQGTGRYQNSRWDGKKPLTMNYTANCEIPVRSTQTGGTAGDKDLLYALHGFDLRTEVTVSGSPHAKPPLITITFKAFTAQVLDYYDWSKIKGIKVPNPDFGSTSPGAVAPKARSIQVYHKNAIRIQNKGLAKPFKVTSAKWAVTDAKIAGKAVVDPRTKP